MGRRDRFRRRPEGEGLEVMTLLSGMSGMVMTLGAAKAPGSTTVALDGTARGSYALHQVNPDLGSAYQVSAGGRVAPLGQVRVEGTFNAAGFIRGVQARGSFALRGPRGSVTLGVTASPTDQTPSGTYHFTYTITGGTGRYRDARGTGTVDATLTPSSAPPGRRSLHAEPGKVALTFHPGHSA